MGAEPRSESSDIGQVVAGRYELGVLLHATGGLATYRAIDRVDGRDVVVKTAPSSAISDETFDRIVDESSVLKDPGEAPVAPLLDLGRDAGSTFFVYPYIEGSPLTGVLERGAMPFEEVLTVGRALLRTLADADSSGVLHREIKPSNIVLDTSPVRTVTVLDRGLARSRWLERTIRDLPVETIRYMSPERAGLIEREIDARSDLFSVGAVLFECLVGRPLFDGATLGEVLRQMTAIDDPDPRRFGHDIPRSMAELVVRLLAPEPEQRYTSAMAAWIDLEEIAASFAQGEREPGVVIGLHDRRRTLAEPAFVGRAVELATLVDALDRARAGAGGIVLLEAESGGGKTRLLEEFARVAAARNAIVVHGQGIDQAAQRPFEVLSGVVADLNLMMLEDPSIADRLRERLADRCHAICAAFPELRSALRCDIHPEATETGPEAFGEQRTIEALTTLLHEIGDHARPAVVVLDDMQWADNISAKLLSGSGAGERSTRHTLLVAAFRSEDVGAEHPLRRMTTSILAHGIEPPTHISLQALGADEVRDLVVSMAGPLPDEAVEAAVRWSDGVPFLATAIVRGLVESGALVEDTSGWRIDPRSMAEVATSHQAANLLAQRLTLLPDATLQTLSIGALLGKRFDLALVASIAGRPIEDADAALAEARRRHIVWRDGAAFIFVHDRLRQAAIGRLTDADRRSLHLTTAHRLEQVAPDRAFDIAYHFDAAGEWERALEPALIGARRARSQYAIDVAQQMYEIAERGAAVAKNDVRMEILEGLGDVLTLRGLYADAGERLSDARQLSSDLIVRARIDAKLGDLAFKRRRLHEAIDALERGLRTLHRKVPKNRITMLLAAAKEIIVQMVHTIRPHALGRRESVGAEADFTAMHLYSRLAHVYWFVAGPVATFWAHQRGMNLAERYPPSAELAQAYSEHAPAMSLIPWYGRGVRYGTRSLEIRRSMGDTWGQGQSLHFLGVLAYCTGRFEECIERCGEAVRLLERTGDRWERNTAEENIALALYRRGDLTASVEVARRAYRSGVEIDEAMARGVSLDAWSKASGGRAPAELIAAEIDQPTFDVQTNAEVLQAEAVRLLRDGDALGAIDALTQARKLVADAGLRQEYVAPILPWLATAKRMHIESMTRLDPRSVRRALRRARRTARHARWSARIWRNNLPHALRESGLLAAMAGRPRRARRFLDRSLDVARAMEMEHESAQSMVARAHLGLELGWRGSAEQLDEGREMLRRLEPTDHDEVSMSPSLLDRFDTVLDLGRKIAAALTPGSAFRAAREAALALLRGDRCVILELTPDGDLAAIAGDGVPAPSRDIARRALDEKRVVVASDDDLELGETLELAGVRSVLCAPILVRGRTTSFLYVEHPRFADIFGDDAKQLAAFIATVVGAALENAEGFAEVQELTRTLERRVADRTRELAESNEQLTRLDQLKTEFIAMAAHDLRNPLTVVAGFAEMLEEEWEYLESDQQLEMVSQIGEGTKRLSQLLENLLHYARIESGELSYEIEPFDIREHVERIVSEQGTTKDRIMTVIEPGLPMVLGDEQRCWQVLTNLISNALKFAPDGSPLEIAVERENGFAKISVTDHGPGIATDDQALIFEKFGRAQQDGEPKKKKSGSGLGLYISRSIVEALGGSLRVDSSPGEGATFTYTLPLAS